MMDDLIEQLKERAYGQRARPDTMNYRGHLMMLAAEELEESRAKIASLEGRPKITRSEMIRLPGVGKTQLNIIVR